MAMKILTHAFHRIFPKRLEGYLKIHDALKEDQLRVLLFVDAFGPTAQINWSRPLGRAREKGSCALWVFEEKEIEARARKHGSEKLRRDLKVLVEAMRPDVIVGSRYGGVSAAIILEAARAAGVPVIFHIDDNLLAVPAELGAAKVARYGAPKRQEALKLLLNESDLVYVSTERLFHQLISAGIQPRRHFVGAIAGGVDMVPSLPPQASGRPLKIGYMASSSHSHDLAPLLPTLERILDEHREIEFELFGSIQMPPQLNGRGCSHHLAISDYGEFIQALAALQWDIALAPLRLTDFNLAKTNTKWIEYTAAGIPVVCSAHPVYEEVGASGAALMASSDLDWYNCLVSLIESPDRRQALLGTAQTVLKDRYSVSHLRQQLGALFTTAGIAEKAHRLL